MRWFETLCHCLHGHSARIRTCSKNVYVNPMSRHITCARAHTCHPCSCTPTMMADLVSKSTRWQLVVGYALRCLEPSDAIARRFPIHKALKSAVRASGLLTQGVKVASRAGRCDGVPAPVCARLIVHTVICERFTLIGCVFSQSRRTMLGVAWPCSKMFRKFPSTGHLLRSDILLQFPLSISDRTLTYTCASPDLRCLGHADVFAHPRPCQP